MWRVKTELQNEQCWRSHLPHTSGAGWKTRKRMGMAALHPEAAAASWEKAIARLNPLPQTLSGQQPPALQHCWAVWPELPFPGLFTYFFSTCLCTGSSLTQLSPLLNTSHTHTHTSILCSIKDYRKGEHADGAATSISNQGVYGICKTNRWMRVERASRGRGDWVRTEWVDGKAGEWIELHIEQSGMKWKCWMPEVGVKGK